MPAGDRNADDLQSFYAEEARNGNGGSAFCPDAGTPNQAMATFLTRAFPLPHE